MPTDCALRSLPDLRELLPSDLGNIRQASVNYGIPDLDHIALLNATTGEHVASLGGVPDDQPGHILRVGRERLRHYLWKDVSVTMGKKFSHYVEDPAGVTAYFSDGSNATGTMLVGADGAHSYVRKQLLGDEHQWVVSSLIPIVGVFELPREVYGKLSCSQKTLPGWTGVPGQGPETDVSGLCDRGISNLISRRAFSPPRPHHGLEFMQAAECFRRCV